MDRVSGIHRTPVSQLTTGQLGSQEAVTQSIRPEDLGIGLLFDILGDAIIVADAPTGRVVLWNAAASEIFGYDPGEAIGMDLDALVPDRLKELCRAGRSRYHETGHGAHVDSHRPFEMPALHKTGGELMVEMSLSPITSALAPGDFVLAIVRDISERKRVETELAERNALFQGILDATPDSTILVNDRGQIMVSNPQTVREFGYSLDELVGKPVEILMPERFRHGHPALRQGFFREPRMRAMGSGLELSARRKDGTEFPIEVSLSPLEFGGRPYVLAVIRDITERKQVDRMKDEFLSVISHELRTPLNFITGFASLMDDEAVGPVGEVQHSYLKRILEGADRMLILVNNLLDASQMAAGKFRLSRSVTEYPPVVKSAVSSLLPLAKAKTIAITVDLDAPGEIQLDGQRIIQVLGNLLDNAIKFSAEGGNILVKACVRDAMLITEVHDGGPGIAPEDRPKLFRRFGQIDMSDTRRSGGTGLGLSISKAIVEAHGGQIGVESPPGKGSIFWFSLPAQPPGP